MAGRASKAVTSESTITIATQLHRSASGNRDQPSDQPGDCCPDEAEKDPTERSRCAPAPATGAIVLQQARYADAVKQVDGQVRNCDNQADRGVEVCRPDQTRTREQGERCQQSQEDEECSTGKHRGAEA